MTLDTYAHCVILQRVIASGLVILSSLLTGDQNGKNNIVRICQNGGLPNLRSIGEKRELDCIARLIEQEEKVLL